MYSLLLLLKSVPSLCPVAGLFVFFPLPVHFFSAASHLRRMIEPSDEDRVENKSRKKKEGEEDGEKEEASVIIKVEYYFFYGRIKVSLIAIFRLGCFDSAL